MLRCLQHLQENFVGLLVEAHKGVLVRRRQEVILLHTVLLQADYKEFGDLDVRLVPNDQVQEMLLEPLLLLVLLHNPHESEKGDDCFVFVAQTQGGHKCRHYFEFLRYLVSHGVVYAEALVYFVHDEIEENHGRMSEQALCCRSFVLVTKHQAEELLHGNVLNPVSYHLLSPFVVHLPQFLHLS